MALLLQTAPRGIPEVITTGVMLGIRTFWVVAALQLAVQVINYFVTPAFFEHTGSHSAPGAFPWQEFGLAMLAMMAVGALVSAISLRFMWDVGTTGQAELEVAFRAAPRAAALVLVQMIPFMIMVFIGLLLLIVPGLILVVGLVLAPIAVVVESCGPIAGLNRSWALVWGRWWRCLGVLACIGISMIAVHLLVTRIGGMPDCASLTPDECVASFAAVSQAWMVVYVVLNALLAPLVCGVMLALYHDLRFRTANLPLRTDPVT